MTDTHHPTENDALADAMARSAIYRGIQLGILTVTRTGDWVTHDDGSVTGPSYTVTCKPSAEVKALIDASLDNPIPKPIPTPTGPRIVSQELIPSKYQVMVGETFTLTGNLLYSDQTSKPVTAYSLDWNTKQVFTPHPWTPEFTALEVGVVKIQNSNSGTIGRASVTIVANDGTVFPPAPAPAPAPTPSPAPAPAPTPAPTPPAVASGIPAPSVLKGPIPISPVGTGPHTVKVSVTDGAGRVWAAIGKTGDDPTVPGMLACLTNAADEPHARLQAMFYADCCHVHVARMDNAYDELGCKLSVTYDDVPVVVPPSSYTDGTYTFWKGCWMPPIRYGKQVDYDPTKIDRSVMPSYTSDIQLPINMSKYDFTWNGLGVASIKAMGTTGERGDIGFYAQAVMAFILNPNADNWDIVRKFEDWASNWSEVYHSEPSTGHIIDVTKYAFATTLPPEQCIQYQSSNPIAAYKGAYNGDKLTPSTSVWMSSLCPHYTDGAHLTSYGMIAAMITGAARDMDNASFWANWTRLEIGPDYTRQQGCMLGPQRRAAWCMRSLFIAAHYSSDKQYFMDEVMRNIAISNTMMVNDFGIMETAIVYSGKGDAYQYKGLALWMQSYVSMVWDAVANKIPEAVPFAQWLGKLQVLFASKPWNLIRTNYEWIVKDPSGKFLTDFTEMARLTLTNAGFSEEDALAVLNATTVQEAYNAVIVSSKRGGGAGWGGHYANGVADYMGYVGSDDSYPAGAAASCIAAANAGTSDINVALNAALNQPTPIDYSHNQKYHLKLRKIS